MEKGGYGMGNINVLPTKEQVLWADAEVGVIIHYDLTSFHPGYDFRAHWDEPIPPSDFNPEALDTDRWIKTAKDMGARYAVLVAKHCTGFCLWQTKEHDYSVKSAPWKNGKGDVVADFFASCKKYGIRPGLYYSASCNQFADVDNPGKARSGKKEDQERYNELVIAQLTELWTNYGEFFEIWFDGGCLKPSDGGADIAPLLARLQPNAVVFQGPREINSLVRWCGNERAEAGENCSAIFSYSDMNDDGTTERPDSGDTFGDVWCPAECDMPNRDPHRANANGWFWAPGEDDTVFSSEELFDRYLKSVGRNGNLLIGMAIDERGLVPEKDAAEFKKFGDKVRAVFGTPEAENFIKTGENEYEISGNGSALYAAVGENIEKGERVTGYTLSAEDKEGKEIFSYSGTVISHKRIIAVPEGAVKIKLKITDFKDTPEIRFFKIYKRA